METNFMLKLAEKLESGDVLDVLTQIASMQKALGWMLYATHKFEDPGIVTAYADGIYTIMEHHEDLLEGVLDAVEIKEDLLKEYRGEIDRLQAPRTPAANEMRREIISAKAREGASTADIAAALNSREAEIELVIEQLEGASRGRPASQRARA